MEHFRLYGNCFIVNGSTKSLIYDLFRNRTISIPQNIGSLYEAELMEHSYEKVLEKYADWKEPIVQLVDFLIENDFGFLTEEPDNFPQMSKSYEPRNRIYSSVVHLDVASLNESASFTEYERLFNDLMALDCSKFNLVITEEIKDLKAFQKLLDIFKESRATWVKVILAQPYLDEEQMREVTKDMRVSYKVFNAPEDEVIKGRWWLEDSPYKFKIIEYTTKAFDLEVKSEYGSEHFLPTQATFTESQEHNPFFNLKVCISKEGEYKNDLAFADSFGNFRTRLLTDLLNDKDFKKLWYMSNDKIEKCKDCQFRYQCVSNSNVEEENGKYYKTSTCQYDPYQNEWLLDTAMAVV